MSPIVGIVNIPYAPGFSMRYFTILITEALVFPPRRPAKYPGYRAVEATNSDWGPAITSMATGVNAGAAMSRNSGSCPEGSDSSMR